MEDISFSDELDSVFQKLKAVLTHPEFQKALDEVSSAHTEQRDQVASTRLTFDALAAKGVPIPPSVSVSGIVDSAETKPSLRGGSTQTFSICIPLPNPFTGKITQICADIPIPSKQIDLPK